MLDHTTRKRIDDCRDILVGKLPDPKSQIEQITIALIYKFMDDMDKEAIDLGGEAKFFADYEIPHPEDKNQTLKIDFEKYSWDHLFAAKVTASQLLSLYSESIEKMEKNPNIPQLFRDIFKNAYLPYRDPETLKLFLKTIGEFEYSHSEKLGDAFEYLLSVMGSQGDAGQFRTPRHIIDFLVAAVDPQKTDTILDPACGTAGFLVSAFKYIKDQNPKGLNPDERKKLIKSCIGYDISPDMVRMSLVNLYLHGFSNPHIFEYDSLTSENRWDEHFDVVLANPPFMSPKGGIRPHKKFSVKSNRSEVLFVDYIAEHLNPKGRAGIIVPEGIIFQSGKAYKELRKMLVDEYLYAVVSLPAGVFNPYSGVKTSILLMDKTLAKKNKQILFLKIDNDGYNLGAQRSAIKGGQLEEAIEILKAFKEEGNIDSTLSLLSGVEMSSLSNVEMAHLVDKTKIAENGDYNLSGERYKALEPKTSIFSMVELGLIIKLSSGNGLTNKNIIQGNYPVYGGNGITGWHADYIIEDPTIVIGRVGAYCGSIHITRSKSWVTDNGLYVTEYLRDDINQRFLALMLGKLNLNRFAKVGGQPSISQSTVKEQKIPLPPLNIQEEIVAEIEGYQKIIDGAKMVVENYKPQIDMDPEWEMVELGEIANNFQYGSSKKSSISGEIVCLRMGNIQKGEIDWTDLKYAPSDEDLDKYLLKKGDVLFNRTNSPIHVGKTGIYRGQRKAVFAGYLIRINYKKEVISGEFLNYCLNTNEAKQFCLKVKTDGINQSNINAKILATFQIPLPPIKIQNQIVAKIEKEQELVNANKELIQIFEQKIKDRIAKVWGSPAEEVHSVEKTNQALSIAAEPELKYK